MAARTHALIIGVSHYDHLPAPGGATDARTFGLQRLESAAVSAARFAAWMRTSYSQPDAKLGSLRLLLSPSPREKPKLKHAEEKKAKKATAANVRAALKAWFEDCKKDPGSVAVLYAAGHGVRVTSLDGGILLLQDFGADLDEPLVNSLNLPRVRNGMRGPEFARRQFYFLDACQVRPEMTTAYDVPNAGMPAWVAPHGDARDASPVFFSAAEETRAWGRPGEGTIFVEALLDCLSLRGFERNDDGDWVVTDSRLSSTLPKRVTQLAEAHKVKQQAIAGDGIRGAELHAPKRPPKRPVTVSIDPAAAQSKARCTLATWPDGTSVFKRRKAPAKADLELGQYEVKVEIEPPQPGLRAVGNKGFGVSPNGADCDQCVSVRS